jgi:AraC-like DNA-binding protein
MRYEEIRLGPPLDSWIECVWTAQSAPGGGSNFEAIVPDGCPELIVQLGDRFESTAAGRRQTQPAAFLVGALSGPLHVRPLGRVHTVGVRFRPGGLAGFLRVPQHELSDRVVPVSALFGRAGDELAEQVAAAREPKGLRRAVSAFLAPRLAPPATLTRAMVGELIRARGQIGVEALATAAGVSPRHLERVFRREVGLSPKRLARVVRLQEVLRRLSEAPGSWVDVALDCGYADQAHLTREFRELAGESPARWIGRDGHELARRFTAPERLDAFFRR